jgi:hypothetical protein
VEKKMKFSLNLLESDNQIKSMIFTSIIDKLSIVVNKSLSPITEGIKDIVKEALKKEPEYASLVGGKLKAELGIPDSSIVDMVVDALANTIEVSKQPFLSSGTGIKGGFVMTMMKSEDFSGVIYSSIASVVDVKGYSLPWLEWLLLRSNAPIVKNYSVKYVSSPYSRSGMAIMVPSKDSWRVPPEFTGSQDDNWTTRAISSTEKSIYSLIKNNIEKYL